jgi:hypothetical protein
MSMHETDSNITVTPTFAIPTAHEAVARVNRWLHRDLVHNGTRGTATSIPPLSTGMFSLNSRMARAVRSEWLEMCMSMRQRETLPGG